jgi:hypothetical protein
VVALTISATATAQEELPASAQKGTGEAEIVAQGPNNTLLFYHATPGSPWKSYVLGANYDITATSAPAITIGGDGQTDVTVDWYTLGIAFFAGPPGSTGSTTGWELDDFFEATPVSAPSIAQREDGEIDVAVEEDADTPTGGTILVYWSGWPTGPAETWRQITQPGETTSTPAIAIRSNNETDIAVQGPDNSLVYYYMLPGNSSWYSTTIAGAKTTYSAPAIFVRTNGEADVVAQGHDNSLVYYHATPGSPWTANTIAGPGTTYSTPAIFVRPDGEADVVAQGRDNSLHYYYATPGSAWHPYRIAGPGTTFSQPSIVVRAQTNEADVVAQGPHNSLLYYHATPGSAWSVDTVAGAKTTYSAPAIAYHFTPEIF